MQFTFLLKTQNTKRDIHRTQSSGFVFLFNFLKLIKGDAERVCCLSVAQHSIGVAINQSLGLPHLSHLHDPAMYIAFLLLYIIVVTDDPAMYIAL